MKICKKCDLPFPLSEFYVHKQMEDGHLNICKSCVRSRVTKHRKENIDRIRAHDRLRGNLDHRVEARRKYSTTEGGREALKKGKKTWAERNPRKRAAEITFGNWIRYRPEIRKPCEVCGETDRVHGHHENYDEPLNVKWLCPKHHSERHKEMRRLGIIP